MAASGNTMPTQVFNSTMVYDVVLRLEKRWGNAAGYWRTLNSNRRRA